VRDGIAFSAESVSVDTRLSRGYRVCTLLGSVDPSCVNFTNSIYTNVTGFRLQEVMIFISVRSSYSHSFLLHCHIGSIHQAFAEPTKHDKSVSTGRWTLSAKNVVKRVRIAPKCHLAPKHSSKRIKGMYKRVSDF